MNGIYRLKLKPTPPAWRAGCVGGSSGPNITPEGARTVHRPTQFEPWPAIHGSFGRPLPALLDESRHARVEQAIGLSIEEIADRLADWFREDPLGREAEARELAVEL